MAGVGGTAATLSGVGAQRPLYDTAQVITVGPRGLQPAGSSVHGILQAGVPEWVAIPFFRGSSQAWVSPIAGGFFAV